MTQEMHCSLLDDFYELFLDASWASPTSIPSSAGVWWSLMRCPSYRNLMLAASMPFLPAYASKILLNLVVAFTCMHERVQQ